jgi:hypothetical protein
LINQAQNQSQVQETTNAHTQSQQPYAQPSALTSMQFGPDEHVPSQENRTTKSNIHSKSRRASQGSATINCASGWTSPGLSWVQSQFLPLHSCVYDALIQLQLLMQH